MLEDSAKGREIVELDHDFFESWYRCMFLPTDIAKLTPSYRYRCMFLPTDIAKMTTSYRSGACACIQTLPS